MIQISKNVLALTHAEVALFGAERSEEFISRIACGPVMDKLLADQAQLKVLQAAPMCVDGSLWFQTRAFERRLDTFLPVASAILAQEAETYSNRPH